MRAAEYFTTKQAEREYPISGSYLAKLRLTGDGPEYIKIGRRVFYSRSAFEAWLRQNRRRSTSECDDFIDDLDDADKIPDEFTKISVGGYPDIWISDEADEAEALEARLAS